MPARHETLLPKLLGKVVDQAQRDGRIVDAEFVDYAQRVLRDLLATGSVSEKDLKRIASSALTRATSVPANLASAPAAAVFDKSAVAASVREPRSISSTSTTPSPLILNTTKRQRQLLADQQWIEQAEADRQNAAMRRVQEKEEKASHQGAQRGALDFQLFEHSQQQARDRELKRKQQDEMTRSVAEAREAARQEREAALAKARKEKDFREKQVHDIERQREEQRLQEHNDQVRHMMMIQAELQRQRDEEAEQKTKEKQEWKRVLQENDRRLEEKRLAQEAQRAEDRRFQRVYVENLERQERERAEAKARKEARAATFQQMANTVALMHLKKVQNVDDKIQSEFEEQQRRAVQDEADRKQRAKLRIKETQQVLVMQKAQADELRRQEREEERRLAAALACQAKEVEFQEQQRKAAQRAEAARMKEFLSTQVQLQHFRETKPLETSIARPESRAKSMYSPSRYTPSPLL